MFGIFMDTLNLLVEKIVNTENIYDIAFSINTAIKNIYRQLKKPPTIPNNIKITEPFICIDRFPNPGFDDVIIDYLSEQYLNHKFEILGSGWIEVSYFSPSVGIEGIKYNYTPQFDSEDIITGRFLEKLLNPRNLRYSAHLWNLLKYWTDNFEKYKPIDWQRDFKSGYRWSAKTHYSNIRAKYKIGADIKYPWELARMQHLPRLAFFALIRPELRKNIITEFRNIITDFIATNPTEWGVNWACTMDVAIRAVNWLIAFDILRQIDENNILTPTFKKIFARSLYEHGRFIINNLEYSPRLRTNHYLADIVGLLFISAYLEHPSETDIWLLLGIDQILKEIKSQFYPDGGNFESSTSYHRLSAQMITYAVAMILGLKKKRIQRLLKIKKDTIKKYNSIIAPNITAEPVKLFKENDIGEYYFEPTSLLEEILYTIGKFTEAITGPDGRIPQIGDNDSGMLLNITPVGEMLTCKEAKRIYRNLGYMEDNTEDAPYWNEDFLDHTKLRAEIGALFGGKLFEDAVYKYPVEVFLIKNLAGKSLKYPVKKNKHFPTNILTDYKKSGINLKYKARTIIGKKTENGRLFHAGLQRFIFPDFGAVIFKSEGFYIALCAVDNGQNGNCGHTHNDLGEVIIYIDGVMVVTDPGTYIYTALPDYRNLFRSVKVHSTVSVENEEQDIWKPGRNGLFSMENSATSRFIDIGECNAEVISEYRGIIHRRKISIEEKRIIIEDACNKKFTVNFNTFKIFSDGYGKLYSSKKCKEIEKVISEIIYIETEYNF